MKKISLYSLLLFSVVCFSQTMTEKWNTVSNRYEYFDRFGKMVSYKVYNSYLKQWETYSINTSQPQSSFNTDLAMTVLEKRQNAYNMGKQQVDRKINEAYSRIAETFTDEHGFVKFAQNVYYKKVALVVINKGLDYSLKSNVDWALKFLEDNYDWGLDQVIVEMENMSKK